MTPDTASGGVPSEIARHYPRQVELADGAPVELELMGSRYCTRQQVVESLELCARGEVWPLVTETYKLEEAETVHARLDQGLVTGRAALVMD